jgi:hypothetical protein
MKRKKTICIALLLAVAFAGSCGKDTVIKYVDPEITRDTIRIAGADYSQLFSIQEFGVLPDNSAETNKTNLQKAIDWAAEIGAALYVTPVENGYPVDGGLVLKKNVSLFGAHGPTGRGTVNSKGNGPTGSLFVITDKSNPFITVESATRIEGIQFYYPDQTFNNGSEIIEYPATIQMSSSSDVHNVTLRDLTFYGEYFAMDFCSSGTHVSGQLLFENCYGYPLSGKFIAIDKCDDTPRILHCHVNPANMREFGRGFNSSVIDAVALKKTYTYSVDNVKDAVLMDVFTFGTYGGVELGANSSGQLTSFNFDCVNRGIYRNGSDEKLTWMITQGSIIANVGDRIENVHAIMLEGSGITSLVGVELFSGNNGALTNLGGAWDFLYVGGSNPLTAVLTSCRMYGYESEEPFTINNANAMIKASSCVDKEGVFFDYEQNPSHEATTGVEVMFDSCDELSSWMTGNSDVSKDMVNMIEGSACISTVGNKDRILSKRFVMPVNSWMTMAEGHLRMSFYVSDASEIDLSKEGCIELTSGGVHDRQEVAWDIDSLNIHTGWNELDLKLSKGRLTDGGPDLSSLNYIRIYHLGIKGEVTFKLDNIRFYQE